MSDGSEAVTAFFAALGEVALPVVVIGAQAGSARGCSTSTLTYVSLEPVMVLTALAPTGRTLSLVRGSGSFSVSVLAATQRELAERAGAHACSEDKFAELGIPLCSTALPGEAPAVAGSQAVLWCDLVRELPTGDHVCCVGVLRRVELAPTSGASLLRARRSYHALGERIGEPDDDRYPI